VRVVVLGFRGVFFWGVGFWGVFFVWFLVFFRTLGTIPPILSYVLFLFLFTFYRLELRPHPPLLFRGRIRGPTVNPPL